MLESEQGGEVYLVQHLALSQGCIALGALYKAPVPVAWPHELDRAAR